MTIEQFWHDDPKLIYVYQKAYLNKLHQEAHTQGYYYFIGLTTALGNAFRKKGQKAEEYPKKPLYTSEKKRTEKDVETEYQRGLAYQVSWVNALSKNK